MGEGLRISHRKYSDTFFSSRKVKARELRAKLCGGGEIRTHGTLASATVFKTVPLNHSGTPPYYDNYIKR